MEHVRADIPQEEDGGGPPPHTFLKARDSLIPSWGQAVCVDLMLCGSWAQLERKCNSAVVVFGIGKV